MVPHLMLHLLHPLVCIARQTSFEVVFVAKGFSSGRENSSSDADADPAAIESATAAPSSPIGEPDMTIVTRVKGPEPGTAPNSRHPIAALVFSLDRMASVRFRLI